MSTRWRAWIAATALAATAACSRETAVPLADIAADRVAIQQAAELWVNGYNARSAAAVASVFASDAWIMKPAGGQPIVGQRAIQDDLQRDWATSPMDVTVSETELEVRGDVAWRIGGFEGQGPDGVPALRGTFIEIWRRVDGEWRIHRDIWTADRTATDAAAAAS